MSDSQPIPSDSPPRPQTLPTPTIPASSLPRTPMGFCPKCRYPMNPGRCPECGLETDDAEFLIASTAAAAAREQRKRWRRFPLLISGMPLAAWFLATILFIVTYFALGGQSVHSGKVDRALAQRLGNHVTIALLFATPALMLILSIAALIFFPNGYHRNDPPRSPHPLSPHPRREDEQPLGLSHTLANAWRFFLLVITLGIIAWVIGFSLHAIIVFNTVGYYG